MFRLVCCHAHGQIETVFFVIIFAFMQAGVRCIHGLFTFLPASCPIIHADVPPQFPTPLPAKPAGYMMLQDAPDIRTGWWPASVVEKMRKATRKGIDDCVQAKQECHKWSVNNDVAGDVSKTAGDKDSDQAADGALAAGSNNKSDSADKSGDCEAGAISDDKSRRSATNEGEGEGATKTQPLSLMRNLTRDEFAIRAANEGSCVEIVEMAPTDHASITISHAAVSTQGKSGRPTSTGSGRARVDETGGATGAGSGKFGALGRTGGDALSGRGAGGRGGRYERRQCCA